MAVRNEKCVQKPFTRVGALITDPDSGERFLPFISLEIDEYSQTVLSYRFRFTRIGDEPLN